MLSVVKEGKWECKIYVKTSGMVEGIGFSATTTARIEEK